MQLSNPSLPVAGNTTHTAPENRLFFPALDGLRAVAFLMVFLGHYAGVPWGWTGVNVFFVLSGFLITGILFDTRNDKHRARNFYVRRTLRIFPLYYGIFAALALLGPWMHWRWSLLWLAWPLYLGNFVRFLSPAATVPNSNLELAGDGRLGSPLLPSHPPNIQPCLYLGHFWSLCVEEQFYLCWPWIVFWLRSRRALMAVCAAAVVLVPVARVIALHRAPAWALQSELLYRFTPFQLDSLLLGGLVALLWRGARRRQLLQLARVVAALCAAAAIVYLAVTIMAARHSGAHDWRETYVYPAWKHTFGLLFVNIFSAAIIVTVLESTGTLARLLSLRPLRWIGRISYGAYVLHDIPHNIYGALVLHVPRLASRPGPFASVLALICTLLLAWLSFRFFETPFLNLKERWTVRS